MSKDNEEKARTRVMKSIEDKKTPKNTIYPSNSKDSGDQIDKIMSEIDEFVLDVSVTSKEIKFTEL